MFYLTTNVAYSIQQTIEGQVSVEDSDQIDNDNNDVVTNCTGNSIWSNTTHIQKFDISCRAVSCGASFTNAFALKMPCDGKVKIDIFANNVTNQVGVSQGTIVPIVGSWCRDMFDGGSIGTFQNNFKDGKVVNITVDCSGNEYPAPEVTPGGAVAFSFADLFAISPQADGIWLSSASPVIDIVNGATTYQVNRFVETPVFAAIAVEKGNYFNSFGLVGNSNVTDKCDPLHVDYNAKSCLHSIKEHLTVPITIPEAKDYCMNLQTAQNNNMIKTPFSLTTSQCEAGTVADKFVPADPQNFNAIGIPKAPCLDDACEDKFGTDGSGFLMQNFEVDMGAGLFEVRTLAHTTALTTAQCTAPWNSLEPASKTFTDSNGTNQTRYSCCGRSDEGWSFQCDDDSGSIECFCQKNMGGGGGGSGSPQIEYAAHSPYPSVVEFNLNNYLSNGTNTTLKTSVITPLKNNANTGAFIGADNNEENDDAFVSVFERKVSKGADCATKLPLDGNWDLVSNKWTVNLSGDKCSNNAYNNQTDCTDNGFQWLTESQQCSMMSGGSMGCNYASSNCTCQNSYQGARYKVWTTTSFNGYMQQFFDILNFGSETGFLSTIPSAGEGFVNYYDGGNLPTINTYDRRACDFIGGNYDDAHWPKCEYPKNSNTWLTDAQICTAVGGSHNGSFCNYQSPLVADYYSWNNRTNGNNQGHIYANFNPSTDAYCYVAYYTKHPGKTQTCTGSGCPGSVPDDAAAADGKYTNTAYVQLDIDYGTNSSSCFYNATNLTQCEGDNNSVNGVNGTFCYDHTKITSGNCTGTGLAWDATTNKCRVTSITTGSPCLGSGYSWDDTTGTHWCAGYRVNHGSRAAGECCTTSDKCAGTCDSSTGKCIGATYSVDGDTDGSNINIHQF